MPTRTSTSALISLTTFEFSLSLCLPVTSIQLFSSKYYMFNLPKGDTMAPLKSLHYLTVSLHSITVFQNQRSLIPPSPTIRHQDLSFCALECVPSLSFPYYHHNLDLNHLKSQLSPLESFPYL